MHPKLFLPAALLCLLATPALAQTYEVSPEMCNGASDSTIEIGNGELRLGESTFTRMGAKKDLGDGWFEARYAQMAEGEAQGEITLRLKITPQQVMLVNVGAGTSYTANLCPN